MKFKNYILNEGRTKSISEDKITKLLNTKCKNNYNFLKKSSIKIYRGVDFFGDYGLIDSNKGKARVSANTFNYFTLLMDNLPSWKDYPKRSRSIICSTDYNNSKNYGNLFYVVPFDDTNIGIAPREDIWISFKDLNKNKYTVDNFNTVLNYLFTKFKMKVKYINYKKFEIALININKKNTNISGNKLDIFNKDRDIIKYLDHIFSPTYNNFKRDIKNIKENKEVWIQGKSLLISIDNFNKL